MSTEWLRERWKSEEGSGVLVGWLFFVLMVPLLIAGAYYYWGYRSAQTQMSEATMLIAKHAASQTYLDEAANASGNNRVRLDCPAAQDAALDGWTLFKPTIYDSTTLSTVFTTTAVTPSDVTVECLPRIDGQVFQGVVVTLRADYEGAFFGKLLGLSTGMESRGIAVLMTPEQA